jgi:Glycosyl transferase family 2
MGAPGCDDAPLIEIKTGQFPKPVTMIYPYYDNPNFLSRQLQDWRCWPEELRKYVRLIIVDDCSPDTAAISRVRSWLMLAGEQPFAYMRIFRIEKDIRWNWLAARNIGAHFAEPGWLLLTDMDHVVTDHAIGWLVNGEHDPGIIYRFSRYEGEKVIHPHPNSWFMTKKMFWKIGGYDERMSGFYGSDSYYRRRCAATAPIRIMSNVALARYEHCGDSSTIRYKRKQPEDAALRPLARTLRGPPRVLSFPYHEETI